MLCLFLSLMSLLLLRLTFSPLSFILLFPEPSFVPPDLSSQLKYFLPGLMEHHHGDHMMSLHWEQLPGKPYDVIALETVTMVTELAEVTGKKGLTIWPVPGNVPINGNRDFYLYFCVPGWAACDSQTPFLSLVQCAPFGLLSVGLWDLAPLLLLLNVIMNTKPQ